VSVSVFESDRETVKEGERECVCACVRMREWESESGRVRDI
jgi:hypothetical protein